MNFTRRELLAAAAITAAARAETPDLPPRHPRVLITPALVKEMARKATGPMAEEYRLLLASAQAGPRGLEKPFSIPSGFMEAGLAYLIERELGRDGAPFAAKVLDLWRQPQWQKPGLTRHFGWQGLLYDWIYDAMTDAERRQFGELLGQWVATWWRGPHLDMEREGWWYNQHWGPAHLDEANHRVALLSKLFIDLAVEGNAGRFEDAIHTNLDEFYTRFKSEGLPALDVMGGIWSESNGHGGYGPTYTVPLGYQTVQAATNFDPFEKSAAHGFAREYIQACAYSLVPHNDKLAYIDDSSGGRPVQFARAAPLFARHYRDGVARWLSDRSVQEGWLRSSDQPEGEVWQRLAWMPADLPATSPRAAGYPLACHFRGAGHVYMRSAWDDPDATWAFFGAGPSYAGHSRDDEGHFLIAKRGQLVNRSGGQGHNDNCYYTGGSLCFNIVTVYHPEEKMIRTRYNENDGGTIRHVYEHPFPMDRGKIRAFAHDENFTYAAADLTRAYWGGKALEVTRQFLYLRGPRECFVIFDRVEATRPDLPKHWMLHLPTQPKLNGNVTPRLADHVFETGGDAASWLSDEAGDTEMLSHGRTRMVLRRLAPAGAVVTLRGGTGHDFWGHPDNPASQYNHTLDLDGKEAAAYRRPPFSPWRLEVKAPAGPLREYFLHVLYLTDEKSEEIPAAERVSESGRLGARFQLGDRSVTALFDTDGPMGGQLTLRHGRRMLHTGAFPVKLAEG